jgi:hypothetical protein
MPFTVKVNLKALEVLDPGKYRTGVKRGMKRSVVTIAKRVSTGSAMPVDSGKLRAGVAEEVREEGSTIVGVIGTNVEYAPNMEYGTGTQSDGQGGKGGVHFPPPDALQLWAERHGFSGPRAGFLVALAIARRGGLKPRRMFRRVLEGKGVQAMVSKNILSELRKVFKLK